MIEINLLPPEERIRQTKPQPFLSIGIAVTAIVLAVMFLINITTFLRNQRQIALLGESLQSVRTKSDQAKKLSDHLQETLRPEATLIRSMLSNEINWAQVLGNISVHIPSNLWLSKQELKDQSEGWTLTLIGLARPVREESAISSVGEFTNKLKNEIETILAKDNIYADIELLTTTKRKMADRVEIVEFKASYVRNR